jgi:glutathione peroxidase
MKTAVIVILIVAAGVGVWAKRTFFPAAVTYSPAASTGSLYDLKTATLSGEPADLATYRGSVTLVVNVASKCGYTPQYEGLEKLHQELAPRGFSVLGFPSNDFGGQEPGSAEDIQQFCRLTYGVTFPMFAKVETRPGTGQSPVYAFLGQSGSLPQWNFGKYVVGKDGKVRAYFPSRTTPDAKELRDAIEQALAAE